MRFPPKQSPAGNKCGAISFSEVNISIKSSSFREQQVPQLCPSQTHKTLPRRLRMLRCLGRLISMQCRLLRVIGFRLQSFSGTSLSPVAVSKWSACPKTKGVQVRRSTADVHVRIQSRPIKLLDAHVGHMLIFTKKFDKQPSNVTVRAVAGRCAYQGQPAEVTNVIRWWMDVLAAIACSMDEVHHAFRLVPCCAKSSLERRGR